MNQMPRTVFVGLLLWFTGCAAPDALDETLSRLGDPDPGVRGTAVFELEKQKDPRAARGLLRALSDPSADVRLSATMAIKDSEWESPDLMQALSRTLHDPDPQVRDWAADALGRIADPASLVALHEAKNDPAEAVRRDAVAAIRRVDFALQAREVRYHPPSVIPIAFLGERELYLKAHEAEWLFTISLVSDADMAAPKLSGMTRTICECPPAVTAGGYLGQGDADGFLEALHHRIQRDPRVFAEFRALRDQALRRFPPPKPADDDR